MLQSVETCLIMSNHGDEKNTFPHQALEAGQLEATWLSRFTKQGFESEQKSLNRPCLEK